MNERLSDLEAWLKKSFFNAKFQGTASKKEEIVIPFVSTHSNFDSKNISITANSLLSNVKDKLNKII